MMHIEMCRLSQNIVSNDLERSLLYELTEDSSVKEMTV
jgi:hypothetical protein